MVKTQISPQQGYSLNPGWGIKILHATQQGQKKNCWKNDFNQLRFMNICEIILGIKDELDIILP